MAGVQVVDNANPADDRKIRIRGFRSFSGFDQPLFVINGIPVEKPNLNAFNPNDIESITVMKDATAVALFGARAANGAILIESKNSGMKGSSSMLVIVIVMPPSF